jgi:heme-degrading monooxygenase HmoA
MVVVLFRSKLVDPATGYSEMAVEMDQLARTMPGFVDVKSYTAEDGERLTIVWWQDEETLRGWREQARHRVAQRTGRDQWYQYYKLDVATVVRSKEFDRVAAVDAQ